MIEAGELSLHRLDGGRAIDMISLYFLKNGGLFPFLCKSIKNLPACDRVGDCLFERGKSLRPYGAFGLHRIGHGPVDRPLDNLTATRTPMAKKSIAQRRRCVRIG